MSNSAAAVSRSHLLACLSCLVVFRFLGFFNVQFYFVRVLLVPPVANQINIVYDVKYGLFFIFRSLQFIQLYVTTSLFSARL